MPIYEYQCTECDNLFELLIRSEEKPACPSCNTNKVEKQLSLASAPKTSGGSLPMAASGQHPNMGAGCGITGCGNGRCAD